MHRQASTLVDVGVEIPPTFDQDVPGAVPRPRHGLIEFVGLGELQSTADPGSVADSLATPTACPQYSAPRAPMRALRVRVLVADWISVQAGVRIDAMFGPAEEAWLRSDPEAQQHWIVMAYHGLKTCEFGPIRMPI
jgi:hypothetical protein